MSRKGDLEKIKQIFGCVNHENITEEEMGVKNNKHNRGKKPRFVDTTSGFIGSSPLMEAIRGGHDEVCYYLIKDQKADLEVRNEYQWTALILAARYDRIEVLKVLIDNNANIKAQDNDGDHAASLAARNGNHDALKMLVAKDRSVIDLKRLDGETPLIHATILGNVDVVKFLVHENANVNLKDNLGNTAIHYAIQYLYPEITKIFKSMDLK